MTRLTLFAAGLGLAATLASGCDREAEPLLCGELAAGDLVITEVRGGPTVVDADGQWIELYNASGAPVELHGLALTIDSISGGDHDRVLLRRAFSVAPGAYAVLGKFDDAQRPGHVDVGWGTEPVIPRDGAITIACGSDIDRIAFTSLPDPRQHEDTNPPSQAPPAGSGTYALGLMPPDAAGNDGPAAWCADATETLGPCTGSTCLEYYKGSPGEQNPACP